MRCLAWRLPSNPGQAEGGPCQEGTENGFVADNRKAIRDRRGTAVLFHPPPALVDAAVDHRGVAGSSSDHPFAEQRAGSIPVSAFLRRRSSGWSEWEGVPSK